MARRAAKPVGYHKEAVLNLEAFAEMMGVQVATVRSWVKSGAIPSITINRRTGRYLIPMAAFAAWETEDSPQAKEGSNGL